ncbi:MAG: hypothetical protein MJE77_10410 [Proteobacteria bacterium]|nr:hypothetical protein [Pseudomonadota bacterium]
MKWFWTISALVVGLLSLGGFVYLTHTGTILGSPTEHVVPREARHAPGAYRTSSFWYGYHGGYRGGK